MKLVAAVEAGRDQPRVGRGEIVVQRFTCAIDPSELGALRERNVGQGSEIVFDTTRSAQLSPELCVGIGVARHIGAPAERRFEIAEELGSALAGGAPVRAFGALCFDDGPLGPFERFGGAHFVVPRWTFRFVPGRPAEVTLAGSRAELADWRRWIEEATEIERAAPLGEERRGPARLADDGSDRYRRALASVLPLLASGDVTKVVLARVARIERPSAPASAFAALASLSGCTRFALKHETACFLGATPELLLALEGRRLSTEALAGSLPRAGADLAEIRRLCESDKDAREHQIVVDALTRALHERGCEAVAVGSRHVRTLRHVHHLATPIHASLREPEHVLSLLASIHPTPAMGGAPRERALALVRELEATPRGLYAAPFGWVDGSGGGCFVVGIRSGLFTAEQALLFTGAGIVAGSSVEAELLETWAKLQPMLAAAGAPSAPAAISAPMGAP